MHSPTTSSSYFLLSPSSFLDTRASPSVFFVVRDSIRRRMRGKIEALSVVAVRETGTLLSCSDSFKKGNSCMGCSGFLRNCKDCDSNGELSLEREILEFKKRSKNPEAFPSMKDLVDADRMDLVGAIIKKGGWLSFGWDLNEENEEGFGEVRARDEDSLIGNECDVKNGSSEIHGYEIQGSGASSASANHSQPSMSSGRTVEMDDEESGDEGILNQQKKQRNNFGFREKDDTVSLEKDDDELKLHNGSTADLMVGDTERSNKTGQICSILNPHACQSKISQHTSLSDAEIAPIKTGKEGANDMVGDDMLEVIDFATEPIDRENHKGYLGKATRSEIRSHVQQLESELSSVLHVLRSIHLGQESSSDDLQKLSDDWEFEENKIMTAQDRLRSIHAKLEILKGRITMKIIDTQKLVEEKKKKKKIYGARRALELLQPTCMVSLNSASEVLVAGSLDGWSTQWKMEKSSAGTFYLWLKLYPGKYEIKFIVDGEWRIDPLRPIIHSNGYENNLLIVHNREHQV